jgi:hypothetical protein
MGTYKSPRLRIAISVIFVLRFTCRPITTGIGNKTKTRSATTLITVATLDGVSYSNTGFLNSPPLIVPSNDKVSADQHLAVGSGCHIAERGIHARPNVIIE